MPIRRKSLEEYFWARVRKSDGCWCWTGTLTKSGQGKITLSKGATALLAHVVSWKMHTGQDVADGKKLYHTCGHNWCVRPDHLCVDDPRPLTRKTTLTQEELKRDLCYDPATGVFTWSADADRPGIQKHSTAGKSDPRGYVRITLHYKAYLAHRLAWLYMTGEWPAQTIDHKDCNPANNAFDNLRLATRSENSCNRRPPRNNTSGLKGVCRTSDGRRWRAAISVDGVWKHIGNFSNREDAYKAYCAAAEIEHGEYARKQ